MLSLIIGPVITSSAGLSGLFWVIDILSIVAILIVFTLPYAKPKKYYSLSIATFREVLNTKLLRLDFSVFSLQQFIQKFDPHSKILQKVDLFRHSQQKVDPGNSKKVKTTLVPSGPH